MATKTKRPVKKNSTRRSAARPVAAKSTTRAAHEPVANGTSQTIDLRAKVRGEVLIRLRVFDPAYTARKIVRLLNAGNASWDVGEVARYYRIERGGKVIAQIEYADEDTHWERYEAE